jgi:hypothetical protein
MSNGHPSDQEDQKQLQNQCQDTTLKSGMAAFVSACYPLKESLIPWRFTLDRRQNEF